MKRIYRWLFLVLLLVLSGCGNTNSEDNLAEDTNSRVQNMDTVLEFGITTDPDHLDPFLATSADSRVILFNIFEGLLKPGADGNVYPAIAESYTVSDDLKTYTFSLKKDVFFHNGNKVKVDDVKYSLDKAMEYKLTGMEGIESVEVIDDKTISINLINPDSEFYYNATTAIVPKDYEENNSHPIGTGPYKFESYSPQQELVLVRNEVYWNQDLPKNDKVVFKIKADLNTVLLDLQAGSLNAGSLDTTLASQLDTDVFDIEYANTNAVQIFCLNNNVEPLNNILVRQAISYAVSADEIMQLAHNGHATRAASPVIPALGAAYNSSLEENYMKNIEKAKQLLNEAGYADGFNLTITVPSSYKQHVDTAQVIVNQLREIGITANVEQIDWTSWLSDVYKNRNYQTTVVSVDGVTLSPRSYLFRYETSSSYNFINYSNPEYDKLYNSSLTEIDENKRIKIYHQLQSILSEDAASVFICDISSPKVFRKGIKGFEPYPIYIFDASTIYFE